MGAEKQKLPLSVIVVPSSHSDKNFWKRALTFQFIYSLIGLLFGFACIIGGMVLFFHGVVGSSSWTTKFIGLESEINDAAPGTILFIVGLYVVWIARFGVKVRE